MATLPQMRRRAAEDAVKGKPKRYRYPEGDTGVYGGGSDTDLLVEGKEDLTEDRMMDDRSVSSSIGNTREGNERDRVKQDFFEETMGWNDLGATEAWERNLTLPPQDRIDIWESYPKIFAEELAYLDEGSELREHLDDNYEQLNWGMLKKYPEYHYYMSPERLRTKIAGEQLREMLKTRDWVPTETQRKVVTESYLPPKQLAPSEPIPTPSPKPKPKPEPKPEPEPEPKPRPEAKRSMAPTPPAKTKPKPKDISVAKGVLKGLYSAEKESR